MRARSVLGDNAAAAKARNDALAAFAGDAATQARIRAAATEIGISCLRHRRQRRGMTQGTW